MSDDLPTESYPPSDHNGSRNGDVTMPLVIYILYLASLFGGITSIIGVIIAYIYQGKSPKWISEHYRYQIRTFWIGFLYGIIAMVLVVIIIGYLLFILLAIWLIIRSVKGIQALQNNEAPQNVDSWLF